MYGLARITIFVASGAIRQRFITSENHCPTASQVTKKSLFTLTHTLCYFWYAILCPEHTNLLKQSAIAYFAIVANARYQHYDVIFVDFSCTRKLEPKLIFISEYQPWILISRPWFSRLSLWQTHVIDIHIHNYLSNPDGLHHNVLQLYNWLAASFDLWHVSSLATKGTIISHEHFVVTVYVCRVIATEQSLCSGSAAAESDIY